MKKRLNLRKKANKYKAEAEALRAELRIAHQQLDAAGRFGIRNPAVIACDGRVDRADWHMFCDSMDIPNFTIRFQKQHGNPFGAAPSYVMYSTRLYHERGEKLGRFAVEYLSHTMCSLFEHWAKDGVR